MPRVPAHALIWSAGEGRYELAAQGRTVRHFRSGDDAAWRSWLDTASGFTFHGAMGSLNVYLEARPRGGAYWYAYRSAGGRTRKRYLGVTARVSLARLEAVASDLAYPADPAATAPARAAPPDGAIAAALLPATKLAAPQAPPALVAREPLLAALDAAATIPLTLVAAPAGWGKTTLLAAWARRHPARVAWLALDAADDAPARFWVAVVAALRAPLPGVGATALALLRAPQPPPLPVVVAALVNDLAALPTPGAPLALVLDDYHLIADPAVAASVAYLIDHLPPVLRLVLGTRSDPDLPLARLRARGQLAELRATDLRFSPADAAAFLGATLDVPLADDEVAALAGRTEGWPAGLQLAALALRGREDRAAWLAGFSGGHRFVLDYVDGEILARQLPVVRDFLLRAAVLARLGAELCAAVTGEAASGALLADLERQNLFLIPLDEERRWYRLHDLFREALLARAAAEPGLLPEAHGRAARWHADHGDEREAVGHALAAGDHELAADLIARAAPRLWLAGEARAAVGWLRALPDAVLWAHARLALDAALSYVESLHLTPSAARASAQLDIERFLGGLEEAGRAGAGSHPDEELALIRRRLRLLRAFLAGQALLARADAPGLAALVAETAEGAEREEVRWQLPRLALLFWLRYSLEADGPRLLPQLLALRDEATGAGAHQAALTATVWLAHVHEFAGQLRLAEQECRSGLALASRAGIQTASTGYLHNVLADTTYARNRLDEAEAALRALFAVARTWQQTDLLILALCHQARLALARSTPADADVALGEAEAIARREQSAYHAALVAAERARYWLATGDLASAARWAALAGFAPGKPTITEQHAFFARVRVALALGQHAEALGALDGAAAHLDRPGANWLAADYLALRLLALHRLGEPGEAREVAARLLALTEPEGWLRVYLDGGPPMAAALAALLDAPPGDPAGGDPPLPRAQIARLLAAFDDERRGRPAPDSGATTAVAFVPQGASAAPALIEPLTRREREVLRLLADGATNQEIAAATAVALATAKKHVGNLLGKLGATNRTGAVARARELGLV